MNAVLVISVAIILLLYFLPSTETFISDYLPNQSGMIPSYIIGNDPISQMGASVRDQRLMASDAKLCRDYANRTCRDVRAYDRYSWCYQGQLNQCLSSRKGPLF